MAWSFGDGFDLYAAPADAINGYWTSGVTTQFSLVAGRFAGSQAVQIVGSSNQLFYKFSGVNDAAHHICLAFRQPGAITGTNTTANIELYDGGTVQCAINFRSDGVIYLKSGSSGGGGATLATYSGAIPVNNTWYAFEFEVVINNSTGAFRVRKNGNTVNDFDSGAVLNTRGGTANNYVNQIMVGSGNPISSCQIDDLYWRSDASSVPWLGDIRCYTRMPTSDQSVQFSRAPTSNTQTPFTTGTTAAIAAGTARYTPFVAAYDGTVGTATVSLGTGYAGNMKCSIFAGSPPASVLGSATAVTNPATGVNTFTFGTPVAVAKGTTYTLGFDSDTSSGTWNISGGPQGYTSTTAYASFPAATPAVGGLVQSPVISATITTGYNFTVVNEAQQNAATDYVYDSTVNDADFYGIASIASTPVATYAVTTRGYMIKSDAGTRTAAVQLKSGSATVASPTFVLTTSGWNWVWRTDTVDPNTSAAWTAVAVNNAQVGPKVIA